MQSESQKIKVSGQGSQPKFLVKETSQISENRFPKVLGFHTMIPPPFSKVVVFIEDEFFQNKVKVTKNIAFSNRICFESRLARTKLVESFWCVGI